MNIAKWIGARIADVVGFFRDKPFIPCQIDWYDRNVQAMFPTDAQRAEVEDRIYSAYELSVLNDGCGSCTTDCCIVTDTLGEMREWNNRRD